MSTYIINLNMPIKIFGNSSNDSDNKIDTSLFVQKPYLRTNYMETAFEEDIDLKNQYKKLKVYLVLLVSEKLVLKIMLIIYSTILV